MLERKIQRPPAPEVPESILAPMTGREAVWRFARWAEKLAAEHEARTGHPLPGNQGFTIAARPPGGRDEGSSTR